MPKDTYWFKHDYNAKSDIKIKAVIVKFGWQGYGWFWLLIELLRAEDDYKLSYDDDTFSAFSLDARCKIEEAKEYIDFLIKKELLAINGDKQFYSPRLLRDMADKDKVREQAREAALHRWGDDKKISPATDWIEMARRITEREGLTKSLTTSEARKMIEGGYKLP